LSTKIHATVDALGNPTSFHLTPGQAHDLCDADKLIPTLEANILLADKAYDAAERVIDVLQNAGKKSVIQSKRSHLEPREYVSSGSLIPFPVK
jgi:transposase